MIFTIFKKELKDTLRDRRTIIAMIVVPILVFPLIIGLSTTVTKHFDEQQKEEVLKIALISDKTDNQFSQTLASIPDTLGPKELIFREDTLRSEEHTSELQSRPHLVCRLLLEKKKAPAARLTWTW